MHSIINPKIGRRSKKKTKRALRGREGKKAQKEVCKPITLNSNPCIGRKRIPKQKKPKVGGKKGTR